MPDKILKISGNFKEIAEKFIGYKEKELESKEGKVQVEPDIGRAVFFSATHTQKDFSERWSEKDTAKYYQQGNMTASSLSHEKFMRITINAISENFKLVEKLIQNHSRFDIAFIDNKGNDCGLAISFHKDTPDFFTASFIRHTRKAPQERECLVFQGTDKNIYPDLKTLAGASYDKKRLIEKKSLKQELLSIKDLPLEVKYLIGDMFKENGALNVEKIESYSTEDSVLRFNPEKTQEMIIHQKNELKTYQIFLETAKALGDEKLAIKLNIISKEIEETLKLLEHNKEESEEEYKNKMLLSVGKIIKIRQEIRDTARNESIQQPHNQVLTELASSQQKLKGMQSQGCSQDNSLYFGTGVACALLLGVGVALIASGVLSPIGILTLTAVAATITIVAAVDYSIKAYERSINEVIAFEKLEEEIDKTIAIAKSKGISAESMEIIEKYRAKDGKSEKVSAEEFSFFKSKFGQARDQNPKIEKNRATSPVPSKKSD